MKKILLLSAILTTTTPTISSVISCNQNVSSDQKEVDNIYNKIKINDIEIPNNVSKDINSNVDQLKNAIKYKNQTLTGSINDNYRTGDLSHFSFDFHSKDINKDKFILNDRILVDAKITYNSKSKIKIFYVTMKENKTNEQKSADNLIEKIDDRITYFIPKDTKKDTVKDNITQIKNNIKSQNFNHTNPNNNITSLELDHLSISFWNDDVIGFYTSKLADTKDTPKPNGFVFLKVIAEYKNFTTGQLFIKEKRIFCKMLDEAETAKFIQGSINPNLTLEIKNKSGLDLSITKTTNAAQSQEWICRKIMLAMGSYFIDFNGYYEQDATGTKLNAKSSFSHIIFNNSTLKLNIINTVQGNVKYKNTALLPFSVKIRIIN